jgi:CubicO group peptidase (beta-lactamase class C family)
MYVPSLFSTLETPQSQGLDSAALAAVLERIRDETIKIDSVLVARNGKIVMDAYRFPFRPGMRHDMASCTKSVAALVVGGIFADSEDFGMSLPISADGSMSIGDGLSMTLGLACGLIPGETAQFAEMQATPDWAIYVEELPRLQPAGTHFSYCSPGYHLVSAYVSKVTGESLEANAKRLLFEPLGITDWYWRTDPLGRTVGWGDLGLHPRDAARIGQMILDGGRFGGRQVLPEAWVTAATSERIKTGLGDEGYGYGFWRPPGHNELIAMQGRGGQQVILSPELDLMMVITGTGYPEVTAFSLFAPIAESVGKRRKSAGAHGALTAAAQQFADPPPVKAASLPGRTAERFLGHKLKVAGRNSMGLRSLGISQSGNQGEFTAELMGETIQSAVGFDGIRRLKMDGMRGSAMAGIGRWLEPDHLRLEIVTYGVALRFIFDLQFQEGDVASLRLTEGTGFFSFETTATIAA